MKKILLITGLVCGTAFAQDNFNKLSVDFGYGWKKHFSDAGEANLIHPLNLDLGARYMLNNNFGLRLDLGYSKYKNSNFSSGVFEKGESPVEFNSNYTRFTLSAVANVGHVLNFESFTNRFGLLAHAGTGFAFNSRSKDLGKRLDKTSNFKAGLTLQAKATQKLAFYLDFSSYVELHGHWTADLDQKLSRGTFDLGAYMLSVGVNYYIGGAENHADWTPNKVGDDTELNALKARVAKAEKDMMDDDKDGVPNYLDEEPNTEEGKTVDTKGKTVVVEPVVDMDGDGVLDVNDFCPTIKGVASANGCPDADGDGVYDFVDKCPKTAGAVENGGCPVVTQATKEVLKKAQGIQFENGKATITKKSLPILDNVVKIMTSNPSYKLEINGHTDNAGDPGKNLTLSKDRAASVKAYLMSKGIAQDRLTSNGFGDTMPVASNATAKGKAANRRVEFIIKFME